MKQRLVQLAMLLVTSMYAGILSAKDLILDATLKAEAYYDDQFDLQRDETEVSVLTYNPALALSYTGQRNVSVARVDATYNRFVEGPFEDTDNFRAGWDFSRSYRSSEAGFNISYEERLLTDEPEFDGAVDADGNETIRTRRARVFYENALSPLASVLFSYENFERRVSDSNNTELGNDRNIRHDVSVGWFRTLSPRSTFALNVDFSAFRPTDPDVQFESDANIYRVTAGGQYELSRRWSLDALVGIDSIDVDGGELLDGEEFAVEDGEVLPAVTVSARYTGKRDFLDFSFDTKNSQQLDGVIDRQDSLSIGWRHAFRERLESTIRTRYILTEINDREHFRLEAQLKWQPRKQWLYRFSYTHRNQTSIADFMPRQEISGESNRVTLSVEYLFNSLRFDI